MTEFLVMRKSVAKLLKIFNFLKTLRSDRDYDSCQIWQEPAVYVSCWKIVKMEINIFRHTYQCTQMPLLHRRILCNLLPNHSLFSTHIPTLYRLGESPGLVVMGGDSCSKSCGFEFRHRMDIFSHMFVVKIVMMSARKDQT